MDSLASRNCDHREVNNKCRGNRLGGGSGVLPEAEGSSVVPGEAGSVHKDTTRARDP